MSNSIACPICELKAHELNSRSDHRVIDCISCRRYILTRDAEVDRRFRNMDQQERTKLAHTISHRAHVDEAVTVSSTLLDTIWKDLKLPSPAEQADNLLRIVADRSSSIGERVIFSTLEFTHYRFAIGATSDRAVPSLAEELHADGYLRRYERYSNKDEFKCTLSLAGWQRAEQLAKSSNKTKAFMAMKFLKKENDNLNINDMFTAFESAGAETGYTLIRQDHDDTPGPITDQMRFNIQESRFVIADLTHSSPNAYWEAGYAEGLKKPVFYTCQDEEFENRHFDVAGMNTISWNKAELENASKRLKAAIRVNIPEARPEPD